MTIRVKVQAINVVGSVLSPALQFVLAAVPGQPSPPPSADLTNTTTQQIKVDFANTNNNTGGSPILQVELQMDNGDEGDFFTVLITSQQTSTIIRDGISKGKLYRFRYRASNINGWSVWSEVAYLSAFSIPTAPPAPVF